MEITSTQINKSTGFKIEAQEEGKVLGSAYLYIMYNDLHKEPFGFMENVFVEEAYRGRGIGRALVLKIIEEAKKQNCYKLLGTSRYENTAARTMYEKIGFKDRGTEYRMDL